MAGMKPQDRVSAARFGLQLQISHALPFSHTVKSSQGACARLGIVNKGLIGQAGYLWYPDEERIRPLPTTGDTT